MVPNCQGAFYYKNRDLSIKNKTTREYNTLEPFYWGLKRKENIKRKLN